MNLDQLGVAMDNLMAGVQVNPDGSVTLRFLQCDENGKAQVADLYGSGNVPKNRSLTNVTTLQAVDYPDDNGVKFLTITCWTYANMIDATTKTDTTPTNCVGLVAIDASSVLVAEAWLGTSAINIPSDSGDDQFYIPIFLKQYVKVPLSLVMANNQIHVRSSDGVTPLNFWIGGN